MSPKSLPDRPSLEQYKKQAKDLLKSYRANPAETLERIREHQPGIAENLGERFVLADAQLVVAREHGFESWPKFAKHIEAKNSEALTLDHSLAAIWKAAQNALLAGDDVALTRLLREKEELFRDHEPPPFGPEPGRLSPHYRGPDARSIIASNHHFEDWAHYFEFSKQLKVNDSPIARFETAVDDLVAGKIARLKRSLKRHPELIRARSTRVHRSTLLHYVGANGIEAYRQKTPKNILRVTQVLLDAGADVDAAAEMYGGGATALGLVATSVHPYLAGLQNELIQLLLDHGATIDSRSPDGKPQSAVIGCLANGRGEAAVYLAERGASLDLEGAAGIGRLDVVKTFFDDDGTPNAGATKEQAESGFFYACGWGRRNVVEFLLETGIDPGATNENGETGLHWAAVGPHPGIVSLLLDKGAPIEARDERFGNTPLGWAVWGWRQPEGQAHRQDYEEVVARLVRASATVRPGLLDDESIKSDTGMLSALTGGRTI